MTHITTIDNATVYYWEDVEDTVRYEGPCEIHDHWVKLPGGMSVWVPRGNVQQVIEG